MEPLGHIAGTAASVISAIATLGSAILATVAGYFFNGTPLTMIASILLFASLGALSAQFLQKFDRKN